MTREEAHQLIDAIFDLKEKGATEVQLPAPEAPPRELPKDKRVIRTKTSGDRVYLLDEVAKTRQWITKPEILDELGFIMADVVEVDDVEFSKYEQGTAIYKLPDA